MIRQANKQGQALGRKGEESRRRLLDATLSLIATESFHKLSASKIARAAAMASQSFYLYFKNIDEVLLVLSEEAAGDVADIASTLSDVPADKPIEQVSLDFIQAYSRYWDAHRPILNARNYISDSGNMAFLKLRQESSIPIIAAISDRIQAAQPTGALTRGEAISRAVIIYQAMERIAARADAIQYRGAYATEGVDLVRAQVDIMALLFTPVNGQS